MSYTFEILGVSPVLHFFNHQQDVLQHKPKTGVEYLGSYHCTLDALIQSIETVPPERGWNLDRAIDTVIDFWMNHSDSIHYWRWRLNDAGEQNLLVSRLADYTSLKSEFESLLERD